MDAGGTQEAISTEDLLSKIDKVANEIHEMNLAQKDIFVGSLDVKALYPSLEIEKTSKICAERVRNSGLKVDGIDWIWATKYIALNWTRQEVNTRGMGVLIPSRKYRMGKNPSVLTISVDDKKERWKMYRHPDTFTKEEKSLVLGAMVEIMVQATFKHHFYRWKGEVYRQLKGGPQGLRATGSCAKMVMDDWVQQFSKLLEENKVEVFLLSKYVDDVLVLCRNFTLGSYWTRSKVKWSKDVLRKHAASGMTRSKLTMDILI